MCWRAQLPGQQGFVIIGGRCVGQGLEQVGQVAIDVDAIGLACLDERILILSRRLWLNLYGMRSRKGKQFYLRFSPRRPMKC